MKPLCPLWAFLALSSALPLQGQEAAVPGAVEEISPGHYRIGKTSLTQQTRSISFPGAVNMTKGVLEYLLVTKDGPTHESLLVTEVSAADLHLAMLLLGVKGAAQPAGPQTAAPPQLTEEYLKRAPTLVGDRIGITLGWKDPQGVEKTIPAEDWLWRIDINKTAARGPWLYTGSMFAQSGKFLADQEGTVAALVTNPSALINNPRPGHESDRVWEVNEKAVPPVATPLTITLSVLPANPTPAAK